MLELLDLLPSGNTKMIFVDALFGWSIDAIHDAQARRVAIRNGGQWCHMVADTHDELMDFAVRLGLRPAWIQHRGTYREHFDLTPGKRFLALKFGACEVAHVGEIMKRKQKEPEPYV